MDDSCKKKNKMLPTNRKQSAEHGIYIYSTFEQKPGVYDQKIQETICFLYILLFFIRKS